MKRLLLPLLPLLLGLSLPFASTAALEAAKVKTKHDPKADFEGFHTYRWLVAEGPAASDLDGLLRAAAEAELGARGLRRAAEGEQADLVLAYNAGYADHLVAGFKVNMAWWGQLVAVPGGDSNVTAGLVFLLTRPEGGEPVWSGWLIQRGTTENALMVIRQRAPSYARKILSNYPPR